MTRLDMTGCLLAVACWMAPPSAIAETSAGNAAAAESRAPALPDRPAPTLDALTVPVARTANRAVSFTNRRSAFYYTQTHVNDHPEHAWFRGLSIAGRRIFSDYRITVSGEVLDPALASTVVVRPDELRRTYPSGITETLRLYDDRDVVGIEVTGAHGDAAHRQSVAAGGTGVADRRQARSPACRTAADFAQPRGPSRQQIDPETCRSSGGGFQNLARTAAETPVAVLLDGCPRVAASDVGRRTAAGNRRCAAGSGRGRGDDDQASCACGNAASATASGRVRLCP